MVESLIVSEIYNQQFTIANYSEQPTCGNEDHREVGVLGLCGVLGKVIETSLD